MSVSIEYVDGRLDNILVEELSKQTGLGLLVRHAGTTIGLVISSLLLVETGKGGHEAGALR